MLDVRRMQVLRSVVRSGSVSAAATNLGYTPSAISQQLATLEREVGLPLLEKAGRGVRPTPAGLLLSERAQQVSELLRDTEAELDNLRMGCTALLRLRFFNTASAALIPPAVAKFRAQHPDVRLDLELLESGLLEQVADGEADIATIVVGRQTPSARGVRVQHLADEPYRIVLPEGHPLCDEECVDLAKLRDESWVTEGSEPGPCTESLADAFASAGFAPRVVLEVDSSQAVQGFVAAGLGVALLPRLALNVVHPEVEVRALRNPEPMRHLYVALRETVVEQPAAQAFVALLREAAGA